MELKWIKRDVCIWFVIVQPTHMLYGWSGYCLMKSLNLRFPLYCHAVDGRSVSSESTILARPFFRFDSISFDKRHSHKESTVFAMETFQIAGIWNVPKPPDWGVLIGFVVSLVTSHKAAFFLCTAGKRMLEKMQASRSCGRPISASSCSQRVPWLQRWLGLLEIWLDDTTTFQPEQEPGGREKRKGPGCMLWQTGNLEYPASGSKRPSSN